MQLQNIRALPSITQSSLFEVRIVDVVESYLFFRGLRSIAKVWPANVDANVCIK
jgi:hypothetical protein